MRIRRDHYKDDERDKEGRGRILSKDDKGEKEKDEEREKEKGTKKEERKKM